MRGKDACMVCNANPRGITPACAGKRIYHKQCPDSLWDHPRMCGEKPYGQLKTASLIGSPPHVRGKVFDRTQFYFCTRITPACAGKSWQGSGTGDEFEDHPRMCGEKFSSACCLLFNIGSPPHVRGKVFTTLRANTGTRITPACAGKSSSDR